MSGADGLSEALAAAQARLHSPAESHREPVSEDDALAILRGVARICSHDPEAVVGSFLKGGPLADLVRTVLGATTRPRGGRSPGRPRQDETMRVYLRVLELRDGGKMSWRAAYAACAEEIGSDPDTVRMTVRRRRQQRYVIADIYALVQRDPGT